MTSQSDIDALIDEARGYAEKPIQGQRSRNVDDLKATLDQVQSQLETVQAEKDATLSDLGVEYDDTLTDLHNLIVIIERWWCNATAAQALVGRSDAQEVADRLGLILPEGA